MKQASWFWLFFFFSFQLKTDSESNEGKYAILYVVDVVLVNNVHVFNSVMSLLKNRICNFSYMFFERIRSL